MLGVKAEPLPGTVCQYSPWCRQYGYCLGDHQYPSRVAHEFQFRCLKKLMRISWSLPYLYTHSKLATFSYMIYPKKKQSKHLILSQYCTWAYSLGFSYIVVPWNTQQKQRTQEHRCPFYTGFRKCGSKAGTWDSFSGLLWIVQVGWIVYLQGGSPKVIGGLITPFIGVKQPSVTHLGSAIYMGVTTPLKTRGPGPTW